MRYAKLRIKLVFKYYLRFASLTLALFLLFGAVSSLLIKNEASDETKQLYTVGICGSTDISYLGIGIDLMTQMDSSSGYIKLVECTLEEARERLENGDFTAYIFVPDGFTDSIFSDELIPLEFVTKDASGGMTAVLKEELLKTISVFIVHAQKSYYAFASAMLREGKYNGDLLSAVNIRSLMLVLDRDNISKVHITGVSGGLSLSEYMLCAFSVLWLMLCSVPYCTLFIKRELSLTRVLKSRGISIFSQTICEYLSYFTSMYLSVITAFVLLLMFKGALSDAFLLVGIDMGAVSIANLTLLSLKILPAVSVITAFQFMLFSLSSQIVSGMLIQFFGCIVTSFIGGCMYPISFFPTALRGASHVLPSGAAREYLSSLITEEGQLFRAFLCVMISAVFLLITLLVNRLRLNRE